MDVSDIFFIFFCSGSGEGKGEPEAQGGGDFLWKIPGGGGLPGGWGQGGKGSGGCLRGIWGGGVNILFFGAEMPTKKPKLFWN